MKSLPVVVVLSLLLLGGTRGDCQTNILSPLPKPPSLGDSKLPIPSVKNTKATNSYSTIQAAVDAADPGDTLVVGPGIYAERVIVSKPLTLRGAQAGVDARTRTEGSKIQESILSHANGGFSFRSSDVIIDGFVLQGGMGSS